MSVNTTDHYWSLIEDRWHARAHLKWRANIYSGATPSRDNQEYWTGGFHPWIGSGEVNQGVVTEPTALISDLAVRETSTKLMRKGALIIALAGQGRTKGTVAQLGIDCFGNQSLSCIDGRSDDDRFLFWWLTSLYRQIRGLASDDSRDGLNQEMVGSIPVPVVEIQTQRLIADYLDSETARIDQLIAEKNRMLTLLDEKRAALISRVVTRGLNPNTALKSSGQVWLGDIPAHWRVERAKTLFSVRDERSDDGSEELLTVSHITGVTSRADKCRWRWKTAWKRRWRRAWGRSRPRPGGRRRRSADGRSRRYTLAPHSTYAVSTGKMVRRGAGLSDGNQPDRACEAAVVRCQSRKQSISRSRAGHATGADELSTNRSRLMVTPAGSGPWRGQASLTLADHILRFVDQTTSHQRG